MSGSRANAPVRFVVAALVVAALELGGLAAAGGAQQTKREVPLVFAADIGSFDSPSSFCAYANVGQNQRPLWCQSGAPLTYPAGMWVDGSGRLYVADSGDQVFEYDALGASGPPGNPSVTYIDTIGSTSAQPTQVVTCGSFLYAGSYVFGPGYDGFGFTVWRIGHPTPIGFAYRSFYSDEGSPAGIGCDAAHHVILTWLGQSSIGGFFDIWTQQRGDVPPSYLETLTVETTTASGFAVSADGLYAVANPRFYQLSQQQPAVEFIDPVSQTVTGACTFPKVQPAMRYPVAVAFERKSNAFWVADAGNQTLYRIGTHSCLTKNTITVGLNGAPFKSLEAVAVRPNEIP